MRAISRRAFTSPYVRVTESVEDSKALARFTGFRIIVAAIGMCEAGRIRHHLKNHLWQPSTTVLLAGFQAEGSLGRILQDGAKSVTIMGEEISVKAAIREVEDYSGHADGPELVQWVKERLPIGRSIFLTHGEEEGQRALADDLQGIGVPHDCILIPSLDSVYDMTGEACAFVAEETRPRIDPTMVARFDSHNDIADLHPRHQGDGGQGRRREGQGRHPPPPAPRAVGRRHAQPRRHAPPPAGLRPVAAQPGLGRGLSPQPKPFGTFPLS